MRRICLVLVCLLFLLTGCSSVTSSTAGSSTQPTTSSTSGPFALTSSIPNLHLPAGFQISVYAQGLSTPRFITMGPGGALLVANRAANSIVAFPPGSSLMHGGSPIVIADHLNDPTSLVLHDGYLYVGEGSDIARMSLSNDLKAGPIIRMITDLPEGGQHTTRTVLIGPDNHIYVSIGSDCNVCLESNPHRAAVWIYNMDGSHGRLFSKGLRNAVGLAVNPWNQQVWADVNGRDNLGDNIPPETVYQLVDQGDYGWPRCHAGDIRDPQFGQAADACQGVQKPLVEMQAHSAPLGMEFYPPQAQQFPAAYQDSLYIAFHGSWNRTTPTGYKVVRVPLKNGKVAGPAQDFISGWLQNNQKVNGRPVGITFAPDGTMFVSDDQSGVIYHIWYK